MTLKFDGWPRKNIGRLFYTTRSFVHHFKPLAECKLELQPGNPQFGSKSAIFLSRANLKFYGWPWKTIGHLFYANWSFVHHSKAIGEFSPEMLNSGKNRRFFLSRVTLKFDGWIWKTIGHLFDATLSFVHHFKTISGFKLKLQSGNAQFGSKSAICFVPCDLEIWWMNLKNNRAPLRCYVKLCASFQSHRWIQTEVTVRKRSIRVKIGDFFCLVWPWNLMEDLEKQ